MGLVSVISQKEAKKFDNFLPIFIIKNVQQLMKN